MGTQRVQMKGLVGLFGLSCRYKSFLSCLSCSSHPQYKIFFSSPYTISIHSSPSPSKLGTGQAVVLVGLGTGQAVVLGRLSLAISASQGLRIWPLYCTPLRVSHKETLRRRITVTSHLNELSTDQLGYRVRVGGRG